MTDVTTANNVSQQAGVPISTVLRVIDNTDPFQKPREGLVLMPIHELDAMINSLTLLWGHMNQGIEKVAKEISLIGYIMCTYINPTLTPVKQPLLAIGEAKAMMATAQQGQAGGEAKI